MWMVRAEAWGCRTCWRSVVLKQRQKVIAVVVGQVGRAQVGQQLVWVGQLWEQLWSSTVISTRAHTGTHTHTWTNSHPEWALEPLQTLGARRSPPPEGEGSGRYAASSDWCPQDGCYHGDPVTDAGRGEHRGRGSPPALGSEEEEVRMTPNKTHTHTATMRSTCPASG